MALERSLYNYRMKRFVRALMFFFLFFPVIGRNSGRETGGPVFAFGPASTSTYFPYIYLYLIYAIEALNRNDNT